MCREAPTAIEVDVAGVRKFLSVGAANLVLAASTIETTRLALVSCPSPLMGRNLMAHIRTDLPFGSVEPRYRRCQPMFRLRRYFCAASGRSAVPPATDGVDQPKWLRRHALPDGARPRPA